MAHRFSLTNFFVASLVVAALCASRASAHDAAAQARVADGKTRSAATTKLPLGDGKISSAPKRGYVTACSSRFPGDGGAHRVGEWVKDGQWDPSAKPQVEGNVLWPNTAISVNVEGDVRVVRANNLPKHATGEFPIRVGSAAHEFDRNPNRIGEQTILLKLPASPDVAKAPVCVPLGMIGFALSGVAIFNAFDLQGRDAPAYEIQDQCNGHPERNGQYHYHDWSPCMDDSAGKAGRHSDVVGFMLDGFPIYGPHGEGGSEIRNADLDECHGHTHEVSLDGKKSTRYHYHFTREYPYTIGCFRGHVAAEFLRPAPRPAGPPPRE